MVRRHAILLVGPTGSGKTPLGELLERRGLWGRRCFHFDFGSVLRRVACAPAPPAYLTCDDVEFLRGVLRSDALLEDEHFAIAEKILRSFIAERAVGSEAFVVLNGLPRHVGQADRVDSIVDVRTVVQLSCTPRVVLERIRTNAGGDRTGRTDDDVGSVTEKLAIFNERTAPLLHHYRGAHVPILTVEVSAATTAEDMRHELGGRPPAPGMEAEHDA